VTSRTAVRRWPVEVEAVARGAQVASQAPAAGVRDGETAATAAKTTSRLGTAASTDIANLAQED
jgi:hypothetical protein